MKPIVVATALVLSSSANAALVEIDLVNAGDGLLFLDTETNREWVDVTKTTNMSVNQFFDSSIYSGLGFQLATELDLEGLYTNAGATDISYIDTVVYTAGNLPAAQLLADLMEHAAPFSQTDENSWVHGYMDFGSLTNLTLSRFNATGDDGTASFAINTNDTTWTFDSANSKIGIWAYRDVSAVPVPAAVWLFGSGLIALIGLARRKKA